MSSQQQSEGVPLYVANSMLSNCSGHECDSPRVGSGGGNNNVTENASSLAFEVLIGSFYVSIFLLGVFGNALVCFVVARNRQMQTVTNLFITNLALSDMLLCILAVPFTPLYTFVGSWVFGNTLCHLVPYAQAVSVYLSTLTLTGIAVDRFLVIIYPFKPRMKISTCVAIIVAIWIISLLFTLPYGLYMEPALIMGAHYCEEHWPSEEFRMTFGTISTTLQFAVPFVVISICYACIWSRLRDQARMKPGNKSSRGEVVDRERKRRMNCMLVSMVLIFGVSWLPLNIVNVVEDFYKPATDWAYSKEVFFIAHCLAMSSTCYNPFLYAWLNDNFRKEFKQVLPCFGPANGPKGSRCRRDTLAAEGCRSERTCNGAETYQESLLPSQLSKPYSNCEMISLEPTSNFTKDLD